MLTRALLVTISLLLFAPSVQARARKVALPYGLKFGMTVKQVREQLKRKRLRNTSGSFVSKAGNGQLAFVSKHIFGVDFDRLECRFKGGRFHKLQAWDVTRLDDSAVASSLMKKHVKRIAKHLRHKPRKVASFGLNYVWDTASGRITMRLADRMENAGDPDSAKEVFWVELNIEPAKPKRPAPKRPAPKRPAPAARP